MALTATMNWCLTGVFVHNAFALFTCPCPPPWNHEKGKILTIKPVAGFLAALTLFTLVIFSLNCELFHSAHSHWMGDGFQPPFWFCSQKKSCLTTITLESACFSRRDPFVVLIQNLDLHLSWHQLHLLEKQCKSCKWLLCDDSTAGFTSMRMLCQGMLVCSCCLLMHWRASWLTRTKSEEQPQWQFLVVLQCLEHHQLVIAVFFVGTHTGLPSQDNPVVLQTWFLKTHVQPTEDLLLSLNWAGKTQLCLVPVILRIHSLFLGGSQSLWSLHNVSWTAAKIFVCLHLLCSLHPNHCKPKLHSTISELAGVTQLLHGMQTKLMNCSMQQQIAQNATTLSKQFEFWMWHGEQSHELHDGVTAWFHW